MVREEAHAPWQATAVNMLFDKTQHILVKNNSVHEVLGQSVMVRLILQCSLAQDIRYTRSSCSQLSHTCGTHCPQDGIMI